MNRLLLSSLAGLFLVVAGPVSAVPTIQVSPSTIVTTEGQPNAFYEITLSEEPTGDVMITPSITDGTEGQLSGAVTFTPANWMEPQRVTIMPGSSGDGNDGDVSYTISGAVSAAGTNYESVMVPPVSGTNRNVDGTANIYIDKHQNHETTEEGGTSTFQVFTTNVPSDPITINAVVSHPNEISLSSSTITLNSGNGFVASVTITGLDDLVADGDVPFSISFSPSSSSDSSYNGESLPDVVGVNAGLIAYQPDIRVSKNKRSGVGKGDGIYSNAPTGAQTLTLRKNRKRPAYFSFSVQNDGDEADMASLRSGNFFRKKRDLSITLRRVGVGRVSKSALSSGIVQNLDAASIQVYQAKLKVKRRVKKKRINFNSSLFSVSSSDTVKRDAARIKVKFK